MLKLLMCLFGLHGATEIDYTVDDEEVKVCRDCLKEMCGAELRKINKQIHCIETQLNA